MSKEVSEERTPRTVEDVKEMLTKHSNGEIQRTIQNCITILQNDHVLADAIRLNLLSERIDIVKPVGWPRSGKTLNDTERIPHVLHHFLGAAEDEYTCEAMKIFLLGAIKRVFQPGCKFETMLCLVGGQGVGKSTFFRLLAVKDECSRMTCDGWTMTTCTASCKALDHRNVRDDRHRQRQEHRGDQELSQQAEGNL